MPNWKAYMQLNGDGVSKYIVIESDIPDELYAKIQMAIKDKTPLWDCPFYGELRTLLYDSFDLAEYLGVADEAPQREDFDDEEDGEEKYQEALSEYEESAGDVWDDFVEVSFNVFDPTDELRFKEKFIGKEYLDYSGENTVEFNWDSDGDSCISYSLKVVFNNNGVIEDITDIYAKGLESEGITNSSWGEAYPDFYFLEEELRDALCIYEDDNE